MKTIEIETEAQIIEKRSKFICNVYYITSVEEAENKIKEIKKQSNDARHHCFAYRVLKKNGIIEKSSDDGEPSGTAGAPMLNLLTKNDLINTLVIVTRYFGGILLGTGGLVRAYSESAKLALEQAKTCIIELGFKMQINLQYQDVENFKYYCQNNNISILDAKYDKEVILNIEASKDEKEKILSEEVKNKFNMLKVEILNEIYIKNIEK